MTLGRPADLSTGALAKVEPGLYRKRGCMRRIVALILFTAVTLTAQQRAPEIDSIRQADMKADLTFLASDHMAGRLTDTPQNAIAAEWIASRFERLGLKPVGDEGTYYQKYNLVVASLGADNTMTVGGAVKHAGPKVGVDFSPQRFSASGTAKGEIVFVGYGILSPERGYDDYGGNVNGKIAIAIDHEPGESDPNSMLRRRRHIPGIERAQQGARGTVEGSGRDPLRE